jgi:hypothetical protein
MILDHHCFPSHSLWLWHKQFHGDNIIGNECAISVYGDIITGSDAFRCERTTSFCRELFDLIRVWVSPNCPELISIGDNITNGHLTVMNRLNTYAITKGWMLQLPVNTSMLYYFMEEHNRWYFKAPHPENMYSETIFLPGFDVADLYSAEGIEAAYRGLLLLHNLARRAGHTVIPHQMLFDRSLAVLREIMLSYEHLQPKFIVKDTPTPPARKRTLFLENDIHLTEVFTNQYLTRLHLH